PELHLRALLGTPRPAPSPRKTPPRTRLRRPYPNHRPHSHRLDQVRAGGPGAGWQVKLGAPHVGFTCGGFDFSCFLPVRVFNPPHQSSLIPPLPFRHSPARAHRRCPAAVKPPSCLMRHATGNSPRAHVKWTDTAWPEREVL